MQRERWRFERLRFDLDAAGYGVAVYAAHGPQRTYSLIAYTHEIAPEQRTDRVIAEAWDATFSFFDGVPEDADIERLRANTPKQEAGRFTSSELTLARAQQEHAPVRARRRSSGRRPTARRRPAGRSRLSHAHHRRLRERQVRLRRPRQDRGAARRCAGPFQAEMLTVYLIRCLSIDPGEPRGAWPRRRAGRRAGLRLRALSRHRQCDGAGHGPLPHHAPGTHQQLGRGARDRARACTRAAGRDCRADCRLHGPCLAAPAASSTNGASTTKPRRSAFAGCVAISANWRAGAGLGCAARVRGTAL